MKSVESTICIVSQNSETGSHCKSVADRVLPGSSYVVSSAKQVIRANRRRRFQLLLVDRSLPVKDLEELAVLGSDFTIATFGAGVSESGALADIESTARYRLRHPIEGQDVQRLVSYLGNPVIAASRQSSSRSLNLYRGLVGGSAAIRRLRELIQKIAPSPSNILITGEIGTGKEIVARNIHYRSNQGGGPFVAVNCAAIPPDLLESELFGHRKGAFTGALANRDGRFSMAAGGTLFLNEIGHLTPALQVKLLRALEERIVYPVGCSNPVEMTARLVAATHSNLEERVELGSFREDLFYRLNVVPVKVPSLRERIDDIPELAAELSCRLRREHGITVELAEDAIRALQSYDWPGNVRELANLVERLAVINPNGTAGLADLPKRFRVSALPQPGATPDASIVPTHDRSPLVLPADGIDLKYYLRSTEAALIRQALNHSDGTMSQAATLLRVGCTTLTEKIKRLGLADLVKTKAMPDEHAR